jgi:hypothetical protein
MSGEQLAALGRSWTMTKSAEDLRLIAGGLRHMARYEQNGLVRRVILIAAVAYDRVADLRAIARPSRPH